VIQRAGPVIFGRDPNVRTFVRTLGTIYAMTVEHETCELLCLDLPKAEAARAALPPSRELERWAAAAKALGDPTRLSIAWALRESRSACVCDLAWIVGRDEKLVSHHLRLLRSAGLAKSARQGKMVMYGLSELGNWLITAVTAQEALA
jgi:ArsR family transcriptional regulator, lead/cadmium/zinc/bismuth-responsive transcriptional repressor